jgi:hypothetical protein
LCTLSETPAGTPVLAAPGLPPAGAGAGADGAVVVGLAVGGLVIVVAVPVGLLVGVTTGIDGTGAGVGGDDGFGAGLAEGLPDALKPLYVSVSGECAPDDRYDDVRTVPEVIPDESDAVSCHPGAVDPVQARTPSWAGADLDT